jgi:5,10-methenyltetrahydromethanopterin hydrogenase
MKQVLTFLTATLITMVSFASVKPNVNVYKVYSYTKDNISGLQVGLKVGGKVSLTWKAVSESLTTVYRIEKSVNGNAFKTSAYLMGESLSNYSFIDNIKSFNGTITYRVVALDNDKVVNTLSQRFIIL